MSALVDLRVRESGESGLTRIDEDVSSEPRRSASVGVAFAALVLVAAVWVSLRLSQTLPSELERDAPQAVAATLPETLDGFDVDAGYLPDDSLLGFVEIPAGPFVMGSDPGVDPLAFDIEWWGEGRVQGTIDLPRFFMARFEVTVAQFAAFVQASGRTDRIDPKSLEGPLLLPVSHVSWTDAVAYADWLDQTLRQGDATPAALRRLLDEGWRVALPTEAQWEKAARGTDGRIYPWGNQPRANAATYRAPGPTPVGTHSCPDCAYPLADMAGNVWEWTRSPYQPYPYDPSDDRSGPEADALWVMRGGSFGDPEQMIRAANRGGADPGARRPFIGFRVALVQE